MFLIFNPNFLIILALFISLLIIIILFIITLVFAPKKNYFEKNNPYECGFQPFEDSRSKFEIKYYLVAILYIIFDLELMFLLPWILCFYFVNWFSFFIMCIFMIILVIGFIYEWLRGALRWT